MKSKIKRHSRSALAVILTLSMLVSCMMVGIIATDAAKTTEERVGAVDNSESVGTGNYWGTRNVFFRAPDSWDLATNSIITAWAVRSDSASSGTEYAFKLFEMAVVGTTSNSRLYWGRLENAVDHTGLNISEYIAFTATTSSWHTGNFYISTCPQYTKPLNYAINNTSSGAYMFSPSNAANNTVANNNTISGEYNGNKRDVIKKVQTFNVKTDDAAGATGGSMDATCYYADGSGYSGSSAIKSSSITVDTDDTGATETYSGAVQGTLVTLTAKPNVGCSFTGFYDSSDNLLSSTSPYTYYVLGDVLNPVTAKFTTSQHSGAITLPIVKSVGDHKFTGWTVTSYGSGTQDTGTVISNPTKNDGTATVSTDCDDAVVTANFEDSTDFIHWSTNPSDVNSWTSSAIDTTEGFTLRLPTGASTFGYVFKHVDGNTTKWLKQKSDSSLAVPEHDNTNSTTGYLGKNYSDGINYSITLDSGVWKVRLADYVEGSNGNKDTIYYNFWKDSDVETEYYVAGMYEDGTANFFGTAWDPGLSANKMTSNGNGTYTKGFTSNIAGGTIVFKVVVNGDWDEGSYPSSGNQTQVIYSNSTWVQFDFNSSTGAITVTQDGSSPSRRTARREQPPAGFTAAPLRLREQWSIPQTEWTNCPIIPRTTLSALCTAQTTEN